MTTEELFKLLDAWTQRGWLRPLERAFVGFLHQRCPDSAGLVLLAAGLVSHQLGRGHICLDLKAVVDDPQDTLALPPEGQAGYPPDERPEELLAGLSPGGWERLLRRSALISGGGGNTPLVLQDGRLYLRRYWQYGQQVAGEIGARLRQRPTIPGDLAARLDEIFGPLRNDAEEAKTAIHWQSVAAAMAARSAFCVISGGPGSGKTTTVLRLLGLLQALSLEQNQRLRIRLAAPTGKAAARLTESIGRAVDDLPPLLKAQVPARVTTLHRLLGSRPHTRRFVHNSENPLHVDLLVVDEASMIDLEMMAAVLAALPPCARLVLLGDKDQLASVEAGSVLGDLCRNAGQAVYRPETTAWLATNTGYDLTAYSGQGSLLDQHIVVLRQSYRFGEHSGIGALSREVNAGDPRGTAKVWGQDFGDICRLTLRDVDDDAFARLVLDGHPEAFGPSREADGPVGYRLYLQLVKTGPRMQGSVDRWLRDVLACFGRFQILAAVRKGPWGVEGLNDRMVKIFKRAGLLDTTRGWYPGRPVLVKNNDYSLGLMNGDMGIAMPIDPHGDTCEPVLKVVFPMADGTLRKITPSRLTDVETVFALTVHKSQGSEFEHTALVLPDRLSPVLTRELVYTGITRARRWFTLVTSQPDVLVAAVKRRTHRASGLGKLFEVH